MRRAGIIHDLRNSLVLGVCNNCALFKCTAEHSNFYFLAAFSFGTIHILRQQKDSGLGGWDQKWQFFSDVKYCIHTYILGGWVRKSTQCADVFYGWPLYSCDNCLFEKWPMHLLNGDSIAEIPTHVIHTQIMCYCKPLPQRAL